LNCNVNSELKVVHFQNPQTGWILPEAPQIIRTTNGGSSWEITEFDKPNAFFDKIIFFDNQNGIIGGRQRGEINNSRTTRSLIYKTGDGGETWQEVQLPLNWDWALTDLFFLDRNRGWASFGNFWGAMKKNIILSTDDGGSTWKTVFERDTLIARNINFFNQSEGIASFSYYSGTGDESWVEYTSDGGKSWQKRGHVNSALYEFEIIDRDRFIAIGYFNIFNSTDGGRTWYSLGLQLQVDWIMPSSIEVTSGGNIYISAYKFAEGDRSGLLYESDDYGHSWRTLYEYPDVRFKGVALAPHEAKLSHLEKHDIWLVGSDGLIQQNEQYYQSDSATKHGSILAEQNFPNPFTPAQATQILIQSKIDQVITMSLYNIMGQKIKTIFSELLPQGLHMGTIEPSDLIKDNQPLASGVYLLELKSATDRQTIKINIVH